MTIIWIVPNANVLNGGGDEVNELGEAFYALSPSSHKLAVKGIYELMNWQRADGSLFAPVPAGNWSKELPLQMLASVGWYGFYTQYYYSGDSTFIPVIYDRLHRYLHLKHGRSIRVACPSNAVVNGVGGDWGEQIDMGGIDELLVLSGTEKQKRNLHFNWVRKQMQKRSPV